MQSETQPRVSVLSQDGHPLVPCRPKRARILLREGRATRTWIRGNFAIRMTDRNREESNVPGLTLGITPGSKTTGFTVTRDQDELRDQDKLQNRRVVHPMELELVGHRISMKLSRRAAFRRTRRSRLRYRKPRFDNRSKPKGWLPPSIQHNLDRISSWTRTITQLYPITRVRISTAKFDIQLMENPNIWGEEYQHGTLYGWQLRAYVFHQNGHRCFYCGAQNNGLTLDHIIPTSKGGSSRVANLTAACPKCNQLKDNRPPEEFLAESPDKLDQLLGQNPGRSYQNPGWMNTLMPSILEDLARLEVPVEQTNAALTAWNRRQMDLPKTHCHDATILGNCKSLSGMPELITHVIPSNGRSKQKAHVDQHGTPVGRPFRDYCWLGPRERSRRPTPGHAGKKNSLWRRADRHRGYRHDSTQELWER